MGVCQQQNQRDELQRKERGAVAANRSRKWIISFSLLPPLCRGSVKLWVGAPDICAPDIGAPDIGAPDICAPDIGATRKLHKIQFALVVGF